MEPLPLRRLAPALVVAVAALAFGAALSRLGLATASPAFLAAGVAWGLLLLLSLVGWGRLVARLATPASPAPAAGLAAALGLAGLLLLGGVAQFAGIAGRPLLLVLVAVGAGLAAAPLAGPRSSLPDRFRSLRAAAAGDPLLALATLAVVALALLHLAGSVAGNVWNNVDYRPFDPHDDEQSYLALVRRLLDTGTLGVDPFDSRRLASLGGQTLFQALAVAPLPLRAIHLADAGVALVAAALLLLGLGARFGLSPRARLLPPAFLLLAPTLEARGNSTALLSGVLLLLALAHLLVDSGESPPPGWRGVLPAGLVLAAIATLKGTLLPPAVLLLGAAAVAVSLRRGDLGPIGFAARSGSTAVAALLPWCIAQRLATGTFYFPLLGRGSWTPGEKLALSGMPPEAFVVSAGEWVDLLARPLPLLLPLGLLALAARAGRRAGLDVGLAVAAVGSAILFTTMNDPWLDRSLARYLAPIWLAATGALLAAVLAPADDDGSPSSPVLAAVAAAVLLGHLLGDAGSLRAQPARLAKNVLDARSGAPLVDPAERERHAAIERAVPAGVPVLARLRAPHLVDPARAGWQLLSSPGMASPAPGLPLGDGGEALARALAGRGIRHLAWGGRRDGRTLLMLGEKEIRDRYPKSKVRWTMLSAHREFDAAVRELATTRRRLLDTADDLVLDLSVRALRLEVDEAPGRWSGLSADGRLAGAARIGAIGYEPGADETRLFVVTREWDLPGHAADANMTVSIDGLPAPPLGRVGRSLAFALPSGTRRIDEVTIAIPEGVVPPPAIAGISTRDPDAAPSPKAIAALRIGPADAPTRLGFHADHGWTDGDALLDGFAWTVPAGGARLALVVGPEHPWGDDGGRLALDLRADGLPLRFAAAEGRTYLFDLPAGRPALHRLRIRSATFVPRAEGLGADDRRLGVPVAALELRPAAPR